MRYLFLTLMFLSIGLFSWAQSFEPGKQVEKGFITYKSRVLDDNKIVWGVSLGATIDFSINRRNSAFRFFVSTSIARTLTNWEDIDFLAAFQSEVEFYRGGVGTSQLNDEKYKIHIEVRNYPQIVFGCKGDQQMYGRPLIISVGQSMSTLYDPFIASVGAGSCFINGISHKRNQQIGYGIVGLWMGQVYYYNDGAPFGGIGLGDRYDRWWTGGGQIGFYYLNDNFFISEIALRYDKFTGYQPLLYELASTLQIDNLPYRQMEKQYFNYGRYQFRVGLQNMTHFIFSVNNPIQWDMQDIIHYNGGMPYHVKPIKRFFSYGIDYQYKYIKIQN